MARYEEKSALNYTALTRELKNNGPQKLYMLWGPEDYLIADFVSRLRGACLEGGAGDFDAKRIDAALPSAQELGEALDAMPFFGGRTFVELRGFDVNKCRDEKLIALLGDIPDWCTVVIILPAGASPDGRLALVKDIKKNGRAVEFTPQETGLIYDWLQRRFESRGKTIGQDAMDRLMFLSGELMNRLIPEIDKICAYAKEGRVTVQDVEAVAHHIPEADTFQMTECLARKDFDGAAGLLSELLAGDSEPMEILGLMGWQMRQLYAAKIAETSGRGAPFVKEILGTGSDYRVRKTMETARKFTLSALTNDVRYCAEYCLRTRQQGSAMSDADAVKELLVRFALESKHA